MNFVLRIWTPAFLETIMSILQPATLACAFSLFVCGLQTASAAPPVTETIRVAENPTRWTLTTQNSSYQIILTENNDLTPGYFGPLSESRAKPVDGLRVRVLLPGEAT